MTSKEYCKVAIAALEDRKAEDVKVIDIQEISPVADYFVIANGTNQNQIQAMRDACEEALYKAGLKGEFQLHLDSDGLRRYHRPYLLEGGSPVL